MITDAHHCHILYREYKSVKFEKCNLHKNAWGLCSLSNVYILRKWLKSTNYYC